MKTKVQQYEKRHHTNGSKQRATVPAFKRLGVPAISIGTSKRYRLSDIDEVLNLHRVSKH